MSPEHGHGGVDLHAHSVHSDGLHTPEEVAAMAAAAGLESFALTDHDTLDGLPAAAAAADRLGLRLVPGLEISSRCGSQDVHLLAWFVDPAHPGLGQMLRRLSAARERRMQAMVRALAAAGAPLTAAAVWARTGGRAPGRPHIAAALVEAGHASSVQNAFDRWIKGGRPGFVALERPPAAEVLALVRAAGGVTGLAHPGLGGAVRALPDLIDLGLSALEVDHPGHSAGDGRRFAELARRHGLEATAGSDFHGDSDRHGPIGCRRLPLDALTPIECRRP